jgi:hypothetical protein
MFILLLLALLAAIAMCGITHTIVLSYQTAGGSLTGSTAVAGDTEINSDVVLVANAANVELDLDIVRANCKAMGLNCTGDCTVKINSSANAVSVTLVANTPVILATTAAIQAEFAADITKLYLSSTAGGTFSIRAILDETP